jgi:hypothetical protein
MTQVIERAAQRRHPAAERPLLRHRRSLHQPRQLEQDGLGRRLTLKERQHLAFERVEALGVIDPRRVLPLDVAGRQLLLSRRTQCALHIAYTHFQDG